MITVSEELITAECFNVQMLFYMQCTCMSSSRLVVWDATNGVIIIDTINVTR